MISMTLLSSLIPLPQQRKFWVQSRSPPEHVHPISLSGQNSSQQRIAGIKSTSGIAPAKPNGLDINLSMIKSKQARASLYPPARTHIYSAKRKNTTISSANSKCLSLIVSKKTTTFWTLKMKGKESSNQHMLRVAHGSSLLHWTAI